MKIVLEARERLDLNISTTFVELASVNLRILGSEAQVLQKARGTYAPYRIRNYTGLPITIWKDWSDVREGECTISHGQSLDWRFDDWKTLREVSGCECFVEQLFRVIVAHRNKYPT